MSFGEFASASIRLQYSAPLMIGYIVQARKRAEQVYG